MLPKKRINRGVLSDMTVLVTHPSPELFGSDRVLLETVSGLLESGANVIVTLPKDGVLVSEILNRGARVILSKTAVLRKSVMTLKGVFPFICATITGFFRGIALVRHTKADVVFVNTVTIPLWVYIARLLRKKVICHVHEAEQSIARPIRKALALPLIFSHGIITNSSFTAKTVSEVFPSLTHRCTTILNGVEGPKHWVPSREKLDGNLSVAYIGRLSERKGIDVAIDALAILSSRGIGGELDIVGSVYPGYEWFEESLHRKVEELGLEDRVHFHGFLSNVWPTLSECDVLLVPSRFEEPFGNTAVEGVLAGRAVIASDSWGLREAANYGSSQLVPPGDAEAIAQALENVTTDWDFFRTKATQDRARAEEKHGVHLYRKRVASFVAKTLASSPFSAKDFDD